MSKSRRRALSAGELRILDYVALHHPITVREVAEHVASTTGQARTTVLTVMERLRKKGHLTRRRVKGVNHYSPRQSHRELLDGLVGDFVEDVLHGSVSPFVAWLSRADDLDEADVEKLRAFLREIDDRRGQPERGKRESR